MKEQLRTPEQEISAALTVHIASGARTSHPPEMIILMSSGQGFMELIKKKKQANFQNLKEKFASLQFI